MAIDLLVALAFLPIGVLNYISSEARQVPVYFCHWTTEVNYSEYLADSRMMTCIMIIARLVRHVNFLKYLTIEAEQFIKLISKVL